MTTLPTDVPARPKLHRHFRLQWEEAQHCHVLLYPEGMVRLNGSAGEILQCCDGVRTVDDIVAILEDKFNATGLRPDVEGLLAHAFQENWIV
ncbi:pyrroloquinoline quinone biosynthesis peptide chaperone PqqD [Actimicrobium antarcticum]|uniref:Pyrroloquinoline quinone biosynthesis peptide chaperone PqqD n=1 Tax=Actimicrobium antarcticum TaxID=1051899 RepID=A0ABP7T0E1_9BURK